jgi:CBS domain-containing protein
MPRALPVRQVMVTDVLTFSPDDDVQSAMRALVERGVDGAPVVDADGTVVGILSSSDLIIEESRFHFPTVISLLGAQIELPSSKRRFEEEITKAFGSTVAEVMERKPHTIGPDATVEDAATLMHSKDVSRIPVVDGEGHLVGLIARGDILRAIVVFTEP